MAHCGWWFLWALPDRAQRVSKALQFCVALPYIGLLASYDEAKAAACLGNLVLRGVTVEEALCASEAVAEGVMRHAYPEVIQHLKTLQREGSATILLSGNIEPMLAALGAHLGSAVVGTTMESVRGRYTGKVVGQVCVLEGKREKLLAAINPIQRQRGAAERAGLVGVGNSVYDVPFLSEVPSTAVWVVRPSQRLGKLADSRGWNLVFAKVRGTGVRLSAHNKTGRLATMAKAACQSMEAALLGIYSLTGLSLWMFVPSSPKPIDKGVQ